MARTAGNPGQLYRKGHHTTELRLWTTLLNPKAAPPIELVELYARRWEHELFYREINRQLRKSGLLQSHTVTAAAQEIAVLDQQSYVACRDGQELWIYAPAKRFGLVGSPDKTLFSTAPDVRDTKPLGPLKLPIPAEQLALLPFLTDVKVLPGKSVAATPCRVLMVTPKPEATEALKVPQGTLRLWIRSNSLPSTGCRACRSRVRR